MRSMVWRFLTPFLVLLSASACSHTPHLASGEYAFVGVNVIPMDEKEDVLRDMTVVVAGGIITEISPSSSIVLSPGTESIDGHHRYLVPGFADMHAHVTSEEDLLLYLSNGVTSVRNMAGDSTTLALRQKLDNDEILGPRLITAGPIIDHSPASGPTFVSVNGPASAREEVEHQCEAGYDFIKFYSNLRRDEFEAVSVAANDCGIPFAGHTPHSVGLSAVLEARPISVEHLTGWDEAVARDGIDLGVGMISELPAERLLIARKIRQGKIDIQDVFDAEKRTSIANEFAEANVWSVPTLYFLQQLFLTTEEAREKFESEGLDLVSPTIRMFWSPDNPYLKALDVDGAFEAMQVYSKESALQVKALYEAGAPLLVGSDAPNRFVFPGSSVHDELSAFVGAGVSEYDALCAATRNPAKFLNQEGARGVVAKGAAADLVLLRGNPIEDITFTRAIEGVSLKGTWHDRDKIDGYLRRVRETYAEPQVEN